MQEVSNHVIVSRETFSCTNTKCGICDFFHAADVVKSAIFMGVHGNVSRET